MNQAIFAAVLAITLGIATGFPMFTCDKLKGVKEGEDNHDQYLVTLNDPHNYMDAEYVIELVNQYQTSLELHASNVYESSVRSQLSLSENAGVLQGTLSKQALFLVCLDSKVEKITPDYPEEISLPEGSAEAENTASCFKLVLNGAYTGNDYSITFKSKTSLSTMYQVIAKLELAKHDDNTITFNYLYAARKGNFINMVAKMNGRALEMVCKEPKVKLIKPNYDTSVINKRDATAISESGFTTTTPTDHCGLPEHPDEYPTFIFVYNKGADVNAIKQTVETYTENSAEVISAIPLTYVGMIIFTMNRAAYLQACTNSEIKSVEYNQPIPTADPTTPPPSTDHCSLPEHQDEFPKYLFVYNKEADLEAIKQSAEGYTENAAEVISAITLPRVHQIIFKMNRAAYLQACTSSEIKSVEYDGVVTTAASTDEPQSTNTQSTDASQPAINICQQVDSLQDLRQTYIATLRTPSRTRGKENRCLRLVTKLQNKADESSDDNFWVLTYPSSCSTNEAEVTLTARLSLEALKYMCGLKGLEIRPALLPGRDITVGPGVIGIGGVSLS